MESPAGTYFRGGHTGYARLTPPVAVTREWFVPAAGGAVVVRDRLAGVGQRKLTWRFHFDPAAIADVVDGAIRLRASGTEAWLRVVDSSSRLCMQLESGWVSESYGVRTAASVAVATVSADLPFHATWIIGAPASEEMTARLVDDLAAAAEAAAPIN
jgi:hypothetical protein